MFIMDFKIVTSNQFNFITSAKEVMFLPAFVCLFVSKITPKVEILMTFSGNVDNGTRNR